MAEISGGEVIARMLQAEGVEKVFGIIDGTYFGFYSALHRLGIEIVTPGGPNCQRRHGIRKCAAAKSRASDDRPRRRPARAFVCRSAGRSPAIAPGTGAGRCGIFTQCSAPARIPKPHLVH